MKTIDTLIPDIEEVLRNSLDGKGVELGVETQADLGARVAGKLSRALNKPERTRPPNTLYMSEIGKPCLRQVYYGVYTPEIGEKLLPHTQFKFLYGDVLEDMVLSLAKIAGHEVTYEQHPVEATVDSWTIRGRIDCLIDGVLVDVKSASSYAFKKFKEGLNEDNDSFGYRTQLDCYRSLIPGIIRCGWVVVDKQNGTIQWAEHHDFSRALTMAKMKTVVKAVSAAKAPDRRFTLVPDGKSGNEKLCVECSYCPYKMACWADANAGYGLRAFAYATGPVFLGTVVRTPKAPEIALNEADDTTTVESASEGTSS